MRAATGSKERTDAPSRRVSRIAAAVIVSLLSVPIAACGDGGEPGADRSETTVGGAPVENAGVDTTAAVPGDTREAPAERLALLDKPWRALGTEPFWGLEVSDHAIVFTEPAAAPLVFPPAEARMEGGAAVLTTQLDQRLLQATVRDTLCSDGMSDREYEYSARVVLDGEALEGCALPDSTPQMRAIPDTSLD